MEVDEEEKRERERETLREEGTKRDGLLKSTAYKSPRT